MIRKVLALVAVAALAFTACSSDPDTATTAATTDSTLREATTDARIPAECLESDEAFNECYEAGEIPDECFDEEGYLLDACLEGEAGGDGSTDGTESPIASPVVPAECLTDEDAFNGCLEAGQIPDECFDEEGYLLDACLEGGGTGDGGDTANPIAGAVTSGFDPSTDAFSFPNYGDEAGATDLTPAEMQRMFGDQVCANTTDGCTLSPPARQWLEQMNKAMAGGHCEGMAVLSSLFYFGQASPGDFGADSTSSLTFGGNEFLQREIAYWWVTQVTEPGGSVKVNASPGVVLDTLIQSFSEGQGATEWWALGIYKRDYSGGHAITPYAVEDQGGGIWHVYVYDNNYPTQGRILTIDRNAETWQYEASTNPSVEADLYEGDASTGTLEIVAISPRLVPQEGSFGGGSSDFSGFRGAFQADAGIVEVWLDGDANLLITAADGRRIGWLPDGTFVDEIEGASSQGLKFIVDVWDVDQEPVYRLPGDVTQFTITVDGSQLDTETVSDITLIGPDFNMVVEGIVLDAGEQDTITIDIESGDFFTLNYQSDYSDSPEIWFGIATDEADYEFIVRGSDIEPGGAFNVALDFPNGDFIVNTFGQTEYGLYDLRVARIDAQGEYYFAYDGIELLPDDTMYVNFFEWDGDGSPIYLDFDYGTDGTFDDTLVLEDEAGSFGDFEE